MVLSYSALHYCVQDLSLLERSREQKALREQLDLQVLSIVHLALSPFYLSCEFLTSHSLPRPGRSLPRGSWLVNRRGSWPYWGPCWLEWELNKSQWELDSSQGSYWPEWELHNSLGIYWPEWELDSRQVPYWPEWELDSRQGPYWPEWELDDIWPYCCPYCCTNVSNHTFQDYGLDNVYIKGTHAAAT